jgi:hypothetical protein
VRLIAGLVAVLVAAPLTGLAQPAVPTTKVHRIGWLELGGGTADSAAAALDAEFRQAMRERGYAEGQNLVIERRYARAEGERLPALAAELVRMKVDAIVALTTSPVRAARQATSTIPIVMRLVADPVGSASRFHRRFCCAPTRSSMESSYRRHEPRGTSVDTIQVTAHLTIHEGEFDHRRPAADPRHGVRGLRSAVGGAETGDRRPGAQDLLAVRGPLTRWRAPLSPADEVIQ